MLYNLEYCIYFIMYWIKGCIMEIVYSRRSSGKDVLELQHNYFFPLKIQKCKLYSLCLYIVYKMYFVASEIFNTKV